MKIRIYQEAKTTAIFFDEYSSMIAVQTHNTDLKKRLSFFAESHPGCYRLINNNEPNESTLPYGEERKRVASE